MNNNMVRISLNQQVEWHTPASGFSLKSDMFLLLKMNFNIFTLISPKMREKEKCEIQALACSFLVPNASYRQKPDESTLKYSKIGRVHHYALLLYYANCVYRAKWRWHWRLSVKQMQIRDLQEKAGMNPTWIQNWTLQSKISQLPTQIVTYTVSVHSCGWYLFFSYVHINLFSCR